MDTRTKSANANCIVSVTVQPKVGASKVVTLVTDIDFWTDVVMFKAVNFMPDMPSELRSFVDTLREMSKDNKKD